MLLPSIFDNDFRNSFFEDMLNMPFSMKTGSSISQMHSDIKEMENEYQIEINLPGYARDDIQADIKDGYMTISASRSEEKDEKDDNGRYLRRERYSGSCQRSFYVGKDITEEDIKAKFKDGVLLVKVPKKEKLPISEEKKRIMIEE